MSAKGEEPPAKRRRLSSGLTSSTHQVPSSHLTTSSSPAIPTTLAPDSDSTYVDTPERLAQDVYRRLIKARGGPQMAMTKLPLSSSTPVNVASTLSTTFYCLPSPKNTLLCMCPNTLGTNEPIYIKHHRSIPLPSSTFTATSSTSLSSPSSSPNSRTFNCMVFNSNMYHALRISTTLSPFTLSPDTLNTTIALGCSLASSSTTPTTSAALGLPVALTQSLSAFGMSPTSIAALLYPIHPLYTLPPLPLSSTASSVTSYSAFTSSAPPSQTDGWQNTNTNPTTINSTNQVSPDTSVVILNSSSTLPDHINAIVTKPDPSLLLDASSFPPSISLPSPPSSSLSSSIRRLHSLRHELASLQLQTKELLECKATLDAYVERYCS